MAWRQGQRVCSKIRGNYYRIPGTCRGVAQIQLSSLPGLDYRIELDDGRLIVLNDVEIDEVTAEDEEAFRLQQEHDEEVNRRAKERAERMAKAHEESEQLRQQHKEEEAAAKAEAKQKALDQQQDEIRKQMAKVYGRDSLEVK